MSTHVNSLKNILPKAGLIFASVLFVCIFFEAILRVIGYNPFGEFFEDESRAVFIQPSKNTDRIYEARPNSQGKGWGTHITINSYGFRGREYSLQKPDDTYRIIVIGDSITFGNNLPENKNYPALLEKLFENSTRHIEVLNLGLGGYDTLQEVATLEDIGLQFKPDLVILGYCINDIGIASGNLNYIKRLKSYGSPIYQSRFAQFIRVQLDRIELIQYNDIANSKEHFDAAYKKQVADISRDDVLNRQMRNLEQQLNKTPGKYFFTRDYTQGTRVQRLRYGLERLKNLQNKKGFDVAVLIIPYLREDDKAQPIYQAVYNIVEHEAERLDFSTINLYRNFSQAGFSNLLLKKNDGIHPNERGHEIMADVLYKNITIP